MEAVIVAGGLGTRLRPLTQRLPKHLLPVGGIPFVAHQLAKLAAANIDHVVLATSCHADQFGPVLGDGSQWGIKLTYVTEDEPLGTGGAIRNATASLLQPAADVPVVVLNGDILSGHDLVAQLKHHESLQADVTLHLLEVADARAFGCVPTDGAGRVTAFMEKSPDPVSRQINAGCYVFARRVIDDIPAGRAVSVERETFPRLLADDRTVVGYVDQSYWLDLGTPQALCRGSSDLVRGIATSPAYVEPPSEAWVHATASVAPGASIRGGSAVGPQARVEDFVIVEGSVLCANSILERGAWLVNSVVGRGARIGQDVVLRDSFVGDAASVGAGCELVGGARVWCDAEIPAGALRFSPDV